MDKSRPSKRAKFDGGGVVAAQKDPKKRDESHRGQDDDRSQGVPKRRMRSKGSTKDDKAPSLAESPPVTPLSRLVSRKSFGSCDGASGGDVLKDVLHPVGYSEWVAWLNWAWVGASSNGSERKGSFSCSTAL